MNERRTVPAGRQRQRCLPDGPRPSLVLSGHGFNPPQLRLDNGESRDRQSVNRERHRRAPAPPSPPDTFQRHERASAHYASPASDAKSPPAVHAHRHNGVEPQCSLRRDTVRKIAGQKLVHSSLSARRRARRATGYRRRKMRPA